MDRPEHPPRRREGRLLRVGLVIVLVAAAVTLLIIYRKTRTQQAALLRTQQACLNYQLPADVVVYDENPNRAAALRDAVKVPTGDNGPAIVGRIPDVWRGMWRWAKPGAPEVSGNAVLFLHERQTETDGTRLLVCVEADRAARRLRITLVHPAGSTLDPAALTDIALAPRPQEGLLILTTGGQPFDSRLPTTTPSSSQPSRADLRYFAGRPDPSDATHFTLPYESNGKRGATEMWLHDETVVHYKDGMLE
jgi:hypothetical protein